MSNNIGKNKTALDIQSIFTRHISGFMSQDSFLSVTAYDDGAGLTKTESI